MDGYLEEALKSPEPSPEYTAEFLDTCDALFARLRDPLLRRIAEHRLEGFRDEEIAESLSCSRRTVQRKTEIIRRIWNDSEILNEPAPE